MYCTSDGTTEERKWFTEGERRLLGLVENTKDGFYHFELKPKWRYVYANPPFEVTFGQEKGELVYDYPEMAFERVHPDDIDMLMKKLRGKVDYNKRKLEEELEYRITHDRLTGLYNRDYFERLMDHFNEIEDIPIIIMGIKKEIT